MKEKLTIIIGGNADRDLEKLFQGKFDQPTNTLYLDTYEKFQELLSPKKIDLLMQIANTKDLGVCELAKKTKRNQTAISRDLKKLKKQGFVKTKKEKQKTIVSPIFSKIEIKFG